jgi:hypothetical protein
MNGIVILLIIFFAVLVAAFIFMLCYKGNKSIKVHVAKKYIDNNPVSDSGKNSKKKKKNDTPVSKYVLMLKEDKKDTVCSYRCEKEMYDKMRIGKDYEVIIKSGNIKKIIK